MDGATVCAQRHGGSAPQVRQAAVVVVEERRARSLLQRLGEPEPIGHPVHELLKVTAEARAFHQVLAERLAELSTLELKDTFGVERERAVVLLYERSLDRIARILTDMLKLDLQARALRLDEQHARDIMGAISEALRRAGLGEREAEVRRHLRDVLAEMNSR